MQLLSLNIVAAALSTKSSVDIRITTALQSQLSSYSNIYIYGDSSDRSGNSVYGSGGYFASKICLTDAYGKYQGGSFVRVTVPNFAKNVILVALDTKTNKICTTSFGKASLSAYEAHVEFKSCKETQLSTDSLKNYSNSITSLESNGLAKQLNKSGININ